MSDPSLVAAPVSGAFRESARHPIHAADTAAATRVSPPRPMSPLHHPLALGHWALVIGHFLFAFALHAAPMTPPPREVGALYLTNREPPPLFFMDAEGKPQPFSIGMRGRGAPNKIPAGPSLRLLRHAKDPATGESTLQPAFEAPLPAGAAPVLLAFYHGSDGKITHRLIEDDPARHPPGSVRFLNLSGQEVACKLDDQGFLLQPHDGRTVPVSNPAAFIYVYGARQPDGSIFQFPRNRLKFPRPDMRLLVLFATFPDEIEETASTRRQILVVRDARIFDRVPQPGEQGKSVASAR